MLNKKEGDGRDHLSIDSVVFQQIIKTEHKCSVQKKTVFTHAAFQDKWLKNSIPICTNSFISVSSFGSYICPPFAFCNL